MSLLVSEPKFARLPKFAQEELIRLQRTVADLQKSLKDQQQSTPSKVRWGRTYMDNSATGYLNDDEVIYFQMTDKPVRYLHVRLTDDGLKIMADGRVLTRHESSNAFCVQVEP